MAPEQGKVVLLRVLEAENRAGGLGWSRQEELKALTKAKRNCFPWPDENSPGASQWEDEWMKSKRPESDSWLYHLDLRDLEQVPENL